LLIEPYCLVASQPLIADDTLMKSSVQDVIQRIVLGTSFFPLTCFYRKFYDLSILVASLLLRRVDGVITVYLRRGVARGEIVYGLSDIDLSVIIADLGEKEQAAKDTVRAVYQKLSRIIPLFPSSVTELGVYSLSEFYDMYEDYDFHRYRFNEGKHTWKLLFGRDLVSELPELEASELYLPATEELRKWWALLNEEFISGTYSPPFRRRYLWYKAIAEAARVYLLVCHGEDAQSRDAALSQVKSHLPDEQSCHVDRVQSFLRHLTSDEDVLADELMKLFMTMVGKSYSEMERKVYTGSKGKAVIARVPGSRELIADTKRDGILDKVGTIIRTELEPYLDSVALIPQVEFELDVLSNSDIDSFYLVLKEDGYVPIEKLRGFRSFFGGSLCPGNIEPFIVADGGIAFSLQADSVSNTIKVKSPGKYPLFFAMLDEMVSSPLEIARKKNGTPIRCCLPPDTFEETIRKRTAKIDVMISGRNVYKMRTLDFLAFFWGAARTKLLFRSLESGEIRIPLTSRQIFDALVEFSPGDSDWLNDLHREYIKELLGEEGEAYRFFSKSVDLLRHM